jgi:hypothetical protein
MLLYQHCPQWRSARFVRRWTDLGIALTGLGELTTSPHHRERTSSSEPQKRLNELAIVALAVSRGGVSRGNAN